MSLPRTHLDGNPNSDVELTGGVLVGLAWEQVGMVDGLTVASLAGDGITTYVCSEIVNVFLVSRFF